MRPATNIWLVGINTILTPILGKQVNIHPLGECIHPLGNRMQDISRGMNTPSRGMNIHLYFPVSELILCSYASSILFVLFKSQLECDPILAYFFRVIKTLKAQLLNSTNKTPKTDVQIYPLLFIYAHVGS